MTRTAIIGLGIMGRRMLAHMQRHPAFEPSLLWDPSPEACAAALAEAAGAVIAPSAEAAIAGADLVYLACPPLPRKAYALMAAAQGKAVFLEKPLGVDIGQSRDLLARLEATGVPAAVNFTQAAGKALTEVCDTAACGAMGALQGIDIVVTYPAWPRAWQVAADWLRFRAEGGYTREVISHFLFFSSRVLGPLELVWARARYPADPALCETQVLAMLETRDGVPVSVLGSVGGAQPDRQEVTVKGRAASYRISDFHRTARSTGGPFEPTRADPVDPRAESLGAQLDDLALMMKGRPHRLATVAEALAVQELVEGILVGRG